ncbi:tyrosine-type recombinase/integrase [Rhodococcus sp. A5(2022)]|uniref:tyrosine-type recombinase/integrase n=1 Tax=Rhodococcus sp. A5(2022) TaxID=3003588 RepID=UPI0022A81F3D|nr:site-specific integrase [Rhodococcus sp. A5(2022)]MCZ1075045.1 tyrosine-type recombinase/integrase [Rhodococcus sp. A5(2022)]
MATVKAYSTAKGPRYKVRYMKPDGSQGSKSGFTTAEAARDWASRVEVKKSDGEYIDPRHGRRTVDELAPAWLAAKKSKLKPSAYGPLESAWRIHVQPRWGHRQLASIEVSDVEEWITELVTEVRDPRNPDVVLKKPASATTVIRAHSVLAGILDRAVRDRKLAANKARDVENLPRKTPKRKIYLTHEQVAAMAEAAGQWGTLVQLLAYCGLRWGEAVGLRVSDLDMLRRRVNVSRNAVQVGAHIAVGTTKSNKPRSIPIPRFLLEELAEQVRAKERHDLVFPGPDGAYLRRPNSERGWFRAAARKAGAEELTPHDLRHTAASLAVSAGANVKAVQRMLGHESAALTLDVYADLFDDDLDSVADALDRARRGVASA